MHCYTAFCHYPCTPHSLIVEDLYSEPYMLSHHEDPAFMSLSSCAEHFPFASFPKNLPFIPVYKNS